MDNEPACILALVDLVGVAWWYTTYYMHVHYTSLVSSNTTEIEVRSHTKHKLYGVLKGQARGWMHMARLLNNLASVTAASSCRLLLDVGRFSGPPIRQLQSGVW